MPSRRRILIISSGHPCRNPRPVKEATTLAAAGYDVTLLTPSPDPALALLDKELLKGRHFRHEIVPAPHSFSQRLRQWLARRLVARGYESIHALGNPAALLRAARVNHADLVIVHNELPHWIGTRLLASGQPVAADFEDWHSEDLLPADRTHRPLKLLRATERKLLHRARYVSTTSHALADALHARYGGPRPEVLTNAFPLQPAPSVSQPSTLNSQPAPPPSFFWFSQTLGPGRGLEAFLAAWKLTTAPSRVVLLGEPVPGFEQKLLAPLSSAQRTCIRFLPLVPNAALPALIAEHDIGLALEDPAIVNRDLTITNKILQYLNAGLALVATDTAGQREVLACSPDAGLILPRIADATEHARLLDHLLADSSALLARKQAARLLAETQYCWEKESPRLLALVEKALA
ncbi:glycosyl transferase family 1 [Nibricoccus aquaticus]|uniref:Glycosyl transferase family 1 n=1 Tax=Nibricoccus aquaticus TaxID=2576891 RepID=A0A290QN64_9BACT|nr:glycosyltransferase [Nibricoccus aquaticus]ATC65702.1 glycosyl transferase family 1 [Nibricoccus aquaticus]